MGFGTGGAHRSIAPTLHNMRAPRPEATDQDGSTSAQTDHKADHGQHDKGEHDNHRNRATDRHWATLRARHRMVADEFRYGRTRRMPAFARADVRVAQFKATRTAAAGITIGKLALGTMFEPLCASGAATQATAAARASSPRRGDDGVTAWTSNQGAFAHGIGSSQMATSRGCRERAGARPVAVHRERNVLIRQVFQRCLGDEVLARAKHTPGETAGQVGKCPFLRVAICKGNRRHIERLRWPGAGASPAAVFAVSAHLRCMALFTISDELIVVNQGVRRTSGDHETADSCQNPRIRAR